MPTHTPAGKNDRLNHSEGSSWCAATIDSKPYLQVDSEKLHTTCAVSTLENSNGDQWVTKYSLQSSKDWTTWTNYQEEAKLKVWFLQEFFKQSLLGNNLILINDFDVQCKLQLANHMQVKWLFLEYGHLIRDKYFNFLWFFFWSFCLCIWMKNLKRL